MLEYIAAVHDSSGYSEAARNYIYALYKQGIKIKVTPCNFEAKKSNTGSMGKVVDALISTKGEFPIRLIHLTPENFPRHVMAGKYNIGYAAWETSKLPDHWVGYINSLSEVFVPSEHNKQVFIDSGVSIPITVIPHIIDVPLLNNPKPIEGISDRDFVFLNIGQWLERKNPHGLLKAYLSEFSEHENVILILKTFLTHPGDGNSQFIKDQILRIKELTYLDNLPRILLITDSLSRDQIFSLYHRCNCYISINRCEGFGLSMAEAMAMGKPTITTSYGGATDFIDDDKTGYFVKHTMTSVHGMPWPIYNSKMQWAEPSILDTAQKMRYVHQNYDKAIEIGHNAKNYIDRALSIETIGSLMAEKIRGIYDKFVHIR